jgi:hypothetical protein
MSDLPVAAACLRHFVLTGENFLCLGLLHLASIEHTVGETCRDSTDISLIITAVKRRDSSVQSEHWGGSQGRPQGELREHVRS